MFPQSRPPLWQSPRFWLIMIVILVIALPVCAAIGDACDPSHGRRPAAGETLALGGQMTYGHTPHA